MRGRLFCFPSPPSGGFCNLSPPSPSFCWIPESSHPSCSLLSLTARHANCSNTHQHTHPPLSLTVIHFPSEARLPTFPPLHILHSGQFSRASSQSDTRAPDPPKGSLDDLHCSSLGRPGQIELFRLSLNQLVCVRRESLLIQLATDTYTIVSIHLPTAGLRYSITAYLCRLRMY